MKPYLCLAGYLCFTATLAMGSASTLPNNAEELDVFAQSRTWRPGQSPSFTIAIYCSCAPGSVHEGEAIPVLDDIWGQDWAIDQNGILARNKARGLGSKVAATQPQGLPSSFIALFFDDTDAPGRHVEYSGPPPDGYNGFVVPLVGNWDQIKLSREGAFSLSTTDWVDPHRTFVITMRAVLVLDGEIRLTSRPVKVNVQPSVTAKTDAAADWVATADSLQVFGASLPEARLAIEEVVPDRPLQAGLLRQIDAFELRASGLSAAEEPLIAWTTLQRDGGELRQSLESGVPVDVRNAVAIRASVIAGQLKILKLVQGGAAEALAGIYSRRLGLNTEQLWATSAVFSRLQGTADDAEPPKSPAAKAEPLIKAYRDFRALLNPQQRVTFDRSE